MSIDAVRRLTIEPRWHSARYCGVYTAEPQQRFASFNPKVEIDIANGEIEVLANFTLGAPATASTPLRRPSCFK